MSTPMQKIAVKKLSEIIGKSKGQKNITIGRILRESGYSQETSENPKLVTESKGFKEELHRLMPEEKVAQLQTDLMEAGRLESHLVDNSLSDVQIVDMIENIKGCKVINIYRDVGRFKNKARVYYNVPDNNTRKAALDMFYKLENKYPKDKEETDTNTAIKGYLDKLSKILP